MKNVTRKKEQDRASSKEKGKNNVKNKESGEYKKEREQSKFLITPAMTPRPHQPLAPFSLTNGGQKRERSPPFNDVCESILDIPDQYITTRSAANKRTKNDEPMLSMKAKTSIKTPKQLYKFLYKSIGKLPEGAQGYYKRFVRQQFNSHSDENDPERIENIVKKAVEDSKWIMKKYNVEQPKSRNLNQSSDQ
uniref:LYR motif-containing protein 9 n=1 Tax=Romanomermis culicivorax TaxID=13658 RepID=A0A915HUG0_ROMCU